MSSYREYRFWSPMLGADAARLSMADEHGQEYFVILPRPTGGKAWRDEREEALSAIVDAIDRGDPPGEVATERVR